MRGARVLIAVDSHFNVTPVADGGIRATIAQRSLI